MIAFGPFKLDEHRRVLLRDNTVVPLTSKAFELLALLVRHPDRVLTKEEIYRELWPRAVVEESNLTQTVFLVRKALGESARSNRYIVTVPGVGYRFGEMPQSVNPPVAPTAAKRQVLSRWVAVALGVATLAIIGLTLGLMRLQQPPVPSSRSIVVSEFINKSGESLFDGMLRRAVTIQLEQSPTLRVISDQRTGSALTLMGRASSAAPTREDARDLCQRTGTDVTLDGEVQRVEDRFVLTLEAFECGSGDRLASVQADADSPSAVLDSVTTAAAQIRSELGESSSSIRKHSRPLREVTTHSLDALQVFSAAADRMRFGPDSSSAIPMFERAIQLDPQFALAHTYLALLYENLGERTRAVSHIRTAHALRSRVTPREQLLIESSYHYSVTGDLDREIATYEIWIAQFPNDWIPLSNLAELQASLLGNYARAIELSRRSWMLEPQQPYAPATLAGAYVATGQLQAARAVLEKALAAGQDGYSVRAMLFRIGAMLDDRKLQDEQRRWSANQPAADDIRPVFQAHAVQSGRLDEARRIVARQVADLQEAGYHESSAIALAWLAQAEALYGQNAEARKHAEAAAAGTPIQDILSINAVTYALIGEKDRANKALIQLEASDYQMSQQRILVPIARAVLELNEGNPTASLDILEPVRRYDLGSMWHFLPMYIRALAHSQAGEADLARAELVKIIENRGISPLAPEWALAHAAYLQLPATAQNATRTQKIAETIDAVWKEADSDIDVVRSARRNLSASPPE